MKYKNKSCDKGLRNHDSLVTRIELELKNRGYEFIYRNTEYSKQSCGEIDLYTVKDNYVLLFEMKSNHNYKNRKKAKEQLYRAKNNCFFNRN